MAGRNPPTLGGGGSQNLINAKGGLHNRLTKTILLKPYNLKGVQQFLGYRNIHLNHKQLLDLYMVFGGIPHYLKQVEKGKSALQIINKVCFEADGLLYGQQPPPEGWGLEKSSPELTSLRSCGLP